MRSPKAEKEEEVAGKGTQSLRAKKPPHWAGTAKKAASKRKRKSSCEGGVLSWKEGNHRGKKEGFCVGMKRLEEP